MAACDGAGLADIIPAAGQIAQAHEGSQGSPQPHEVLEAPLHHPGLPAIHRRYLHAVQRVLATPFVLCCSAHNSGLHRLGLSQAIRTMCLLDVLTQ